MLSLQNEVLQDQGVNRGFPISLLEEPDEALVLDHDEIRSGVSAAFHIATQADLALMGFILAAERRNLPAGDGYESTEAWLCDYLGIGYTSACTKVTAARCLRELPMVRRAYAEGRITWDHVRALITVAGPDTEADLLAACEGTSVSYTWKMVIKIMEVSREDAEAAHAERYLQKRWDMDSRALYFSGQLPEDLGLRFANAIDDLVRDMPNDPGYTLEQKQADALVEMTSGSRASGDRPLVVVHVDEATLRSERGNGQLENGPQVSSETVREMVCEGSVQVVAHSEGGEPIGVGRRTRVVPPWLRRQLIHRDRTCRFGSCRRRHGLHAHHVQPWPAGPTDIDNLVMLCPLHHRKVHLEGWALQGTAPRVWFRRPDGSVVKVGPPPRTREDVETFTQGFFSLWKSTRDPTPAPG